MSIGKWSGIVFCCLVAGLVTEGRQAPARDSYAGHLKAAKDAARFDWTGVLARNYIVLGNVGPAIGNYSTDSPVRDAYYAERGTGLRQSSFPRHSLSHVLGLTTSAGHHPDRRAPDYASAAEIDDGLKAMHLNPADVKYVLITHGHSDLRRRRPVLPGEIRRACDAGPRRLDLLATRRPMPGGTPTRDLVAEDGGNLTLGDATVQVTHDPGPHAGHVWPEFPGEGPGQTGDRGLCQRHGDALPPPTSFRNSSRHKRRWRQPPLRRRERRYCSRTTPRSTTPGPRPGWRPRRPKDQPNPFVVGADAVANYFTVMH